MDGQEVGMVSDVSVEVYDPPKPFHLTHGEFHYFRDKIDELEAAVHGKDVYIKYLKRRVRELNDELKANHEDINDA